MAYAVARHDICLKAFYARLPSSLHLLRTRINSHHLELQKGRVKEFQQQFCTIILVLNKKKMRISTEEWFARGPVLTSKKKKKARHRFPKSKSKLLFATLCFSHTMLSPSRDCIPSIEGRTSSAQSRSVTISASSLFLDLKSWPPWANGNIQVYGINSVS